MAAPTPTTYQRQVGHYGYTAWSGLWTDGTNITASVVVDVSALGEGYTTQVKILKLQMVATSAISALLEFDATTNQFITKSSIGNVDNIIIDFKDNTDRGLVKSAAGSTGDIVITTLAAAAAQEVTVHLWWYAN